MKTGSKRISKRKGRKRKPITTQTKFHKRIKSIFQSMGMTYLETENKDLILPSRKVEIDFVLIYQNILIIGEETTAKPSRQNIRDHVRGKQQAFEAILDNFQLFISWLRDLHPESADMLEDDSIHNIKKRFIYCSMYPTQIPGEEKEKLYSNMQFMEPSVISYFEQMTKCLKHTEMYEFLHFLGLEQKDVGYPTNERDMKGIDNTIITPESGIGLDKGVRVVSFMMSAEKLMRAAYVLRKDSWNDASSCYQRLIKPSRLSKIRAYIAEKKNSFINNIIVALPTGVTFTDRANNPVDIFDENYSRDFDDLKMSLPLEMNSICIIDGQHRVFAHYEGGAKDRYEQEIARLRERRYLLVTGLVFPSTMPENRRLQIQSQLFLDINQNTQKVPQDVTLQIVRTAEPLSDISIATKVLELMNEEKPFVDKFEFSGLSDGQHRIKTTSIILYGLRKVVSTRKSDDDNLFEYWRSWRNSNGEISDITDDTVDSYSQYCKKELITFFLAVKSRFSEQWKIAEGIDPGTQALKEPLNAQQRESELQKLQQQSKLFSVVSINGFIMCFGKLIAETGLCTTPQYQEMLKDLSDIDFSSKEFSYTSSQYSIFSEKLISEIRRGDCFRQMKEVKNAS